MNSKLVAVGLGAFGYGALVAWSITADHFEGKMKRNQLILAEMLARKEREIVSLEDRVLSRVPWNAPDPDAVEALQEGTIGDILAQDGVEFDSIVDRSGAVVETPAATIEEVQEEPVDEVAIEHRRRDLQSLIDEYTADPHDRDAFVAKASNTLEYAKETPPFHISRESYASDPEEGDAYAKITLTYFPRERVMIDDDEDIIDDVENYVGWRNLARFGDESGDPDTVFVRNRRLLTDFEVIKEDDEDPPIHIRYGMSRHEFATNKAAGVIKFRDEDVD